ncbi:MAG: hypothetical protein ABJM29_16210 [Rhizobiaceae bacterium]
MPKSFDNDDYLARFPIEEYPEADWRDELKQMDAQIAATHGAIDYSAASAFNNVAIYTPALSQGWISTIERAINNPANFSFPKFGDFTLSPEDLQFTNPNSRLCFYPWVLYSAGQAAQTENAAKKNNWMTTNPRDPRVVVIGDSGGFQIQEQTIKFEGDKTVRRMLHWLERVADYSMVMDFPTGKIALGNLLPHTERMIATGTPIEDMARQSNMDSGFITCLEQTVRNNDEYVRSRAPGATQMLNVLQGRNEKESAAWFERVKSYPFEGWAFAGKHHSELAISLRRLIQMRDEGLLMDCPWIHFLGVSTPKVGAALSYLQRSLREHTDAKNIQLTFDSKSPVDAVINGYRPMVGCDFDSSKWSIRFEKVDFKAASTDCRTLCEFAQDWKGDNPNRFVAQTALGMRLKLSDLFSDPSGKQRLPDSFQQALLIHHNTQVYFESFRRMYGFLDEGQLHRRPESLQLMQMLIDGVFRTEKPMQAINELELQLNALVGE